MALEDKFLLFERLARRFSHFLEGLGLVGILSMFLINLIDVIGAKLFLWPVPGATELIGFSQIVAIAPTIAFALLLGRHIRVEFIIDRFPKKIRGGISCFSSFLSLFLFILLLWQSLLYGHSLQKAGEIGSTSHFPYYPFAYFIAFCCLPVCLAFFLEALKSLSEVFKNGPH